MNKIGHTENDRANDAVLLLGRARFERYYNDADGNIALAISLSQWNQQFAGALHAQLGYVELAVRNALDRQLQELALQEKGTSDWCIPGNAPDLVNKLIHGMIHDANDRAYTDARHRISRNSHRTDTEVTHDDILSQLMWGTWVKLIGYPETSDKTLVQQTLWNASTHNAFPYAPNGEIGRIKTAGSLQYIRRIRNSEAHYDNLYKEAQNINKIIGTAMSVLSSISPSLTRDWIDLAALRRMARELHSLLPGQ